MTKHKVIIKGSINRKVYRVTQDRRNIDELIIKGEKQFVKYETMWEGEIDTPLLEIKESLYIEDLDATVQIIGRVRTTSGSYIYQTNYNLKTIEDEKSIESKQRADEGLVEMKKMYEETKLLNDSERGLFETVSKNNKGKKSFLRRIFG